MPVRHDQIHKELIRAFPADFVRADKNPVHSAVLYLRGGPPGIQRVTWLEESAGLEICSFHYHCLGLSRTPPRDLLGRDEPIAWALAALIRRRSPTLQAEHCLACLRRIATAPDLDVQRRRQLLNYVQTYVESKIEVERELARILALYGNREEVQEVATMITTWEERVENRGIEKAEMRLLEKLRNRLSRRLGERFGALPASVCDRLAKIASYDELMDLLERVFGARSLDELGLAPRS